MSSSYASSLSQEQARSLFEQNGFLLVKNLPRGSDFGADGGLWQVDRFSGVKFVPPGLHIFIFSGSSKASSASPSSANEGDASLGLNIRHAIIKRFKQGEIISIEWDNSNEGFVEDRDPSDANISKEYVKSLDSQLAPFSFENYATWKGLVGFVDDDCLCRVLRRKRNKTNNNTDDAGFVVDSAMMTVSDLNELNQLGKKKTTDENKNEQQNGTEDNIEDASNDEKIGLDAVAEMLKKEQDNLLQFSTFDLRRSWRPDSVGEELTRDFLDKTSLLRHVIESQWNSDPQQILAEIQLSFVLSTFVHNFSCLDIYKRLVSLLLQSKTLLQSSSSISTTTTTTTSSPPYTLIVKFLSSVFPGQLNAVRKDFFAEDLPGLDAFLIDQFKILRTNLWQLHSSMSPDSGSGEKTQEENGQVSLSEEVWIELKKAWNITRKIANERFEWSLPSLDLPLTNSRTTRTLVNHPMEVPAPQDTDSNGTSRLYYDLWRPHRGEDDEYVEMGEDAPVIVLDVDSFDTFE